jgi:hypothetical protein
MDEEEIDAWYEDQKEKLTENYRKKIEKSKNKESLKDHYNRSIENLHKKYERLSGDNTRHNLERFFFNYRFDKLRKKIFAPFIKMKEEGDIRKKKGKEE